MNLSIRKPKAQANVNRFFEIYEQMMSSRFAVLIYFEYGRDWGFFSTKTVKTHCFQKNQASRRPEENEFITLTIAISAMKMALVDVAKKIFQGTLH